MSSVPPWLNSLAKQIVSGIGQVLSARNKPSADAGSGKAPASAPKKPRSPGKSGKSGGRLGQPSAGGAGTRRPADSDELEPSPGQNGESATREVDPHRVGAVRMTYQPDRDGDPDPGEIVWTWVPFEENDGRGKDRPVLVVAVEAGGTVLAVQLTSKDHDGDRDFVPIGSGSWDGEHRPSWVNIDRVMRVHATGMRREAAALDAKNYSRVEAALRQRYGWG